MEEERSYSVYVLQLEGGYFYVGTALDVASRYAEHVSGVGAEWTKLHKPIRILQQHQLSSKAEALIHEDAATLWLMAKHNKGIVRGGRWLAEGHTTIYGYSEAIQVMRNESLTKEEKWSRIKALVAWTIPDSWYWRDILEKLPLLRKKVEKYPWYGRIPYWLKAERSLSSHAPNQSFKVDG